jgi:hypothetical protein
METSSPAQDPDELPARWTHTADTSPQRSSRPRPQRYHRPMGHESGRAGSLLRVRRLPAVAAGAGVVSVSVLPVTAHTVVSWNPSHRLAWSGSASSASCLSTLDGRMIFRGSAHPGATARSRQRRPQVRPWSTAARERPRSCRRRGAPCVVPTTVRVRPGLPGKSGRSPAAGRPAANPATARRSPGSPEGHLGRLRR